MKGLLMTRLLMDRQLMKKCPRKEHGKKQHSSEKFFAVTRAALLNMQEAGMKEAA